MKQKNLIENWKRRIEKIKSYVLREEMKKERGNKRAEHEIL